LVSNSNVAKGGRPEASYCVAVCVFLRLYVVSAESERRVDPDELVAFANELAAAARQIAHSYFRRGIVVTEKADRSPVTAADRGIEALLRAMIAERFPDHGIYGEEQGGEKLDRALVWVLDPIDGTKAFVTGMPLFGTLIGLTERGQPVLGVIEAPATEERWVGIAGVTRDSAGIRCRTSAARILPPPDSMRPRPTSSATPNAPALMRSRGAPRCAASAATAMPMPCSPAAM
jgi:fructose-1,6-bisphosphatase/inositol monophosphatase family enzyme